MDKTVDRVETALLIALANKALREGEIADRERQLASMIKARHYRYNWQRNKKVFDLEKAKNVIRG